MQKVTYIIPIHESTQEYVDYTKHALESLKQMEGTDEYYVTFVGEKDVLEVYKTLYKEVGNKQTVTFLETSEKDLFKKINQAVMDCATPYFSVLECDDTFIPYWDKVAQSYLEDKRHTVILPLTENVTSDGTVKTLSNEIALDAAFADDLGKVNLEELKTFKDFMTSGSYIKTETYIRLGGLKSELKFAAWYEFLLNVASQEDCDIVVLPRVGYKHMILRDDSYMSKTLKEISPEEGQSIIAKALEAYKTDEKEDTDGSED